METGQFLGSLRWLTTWVVFVIVTIVCRAHARQNTPPNAILLPQPAAPAILAAFDTYEIVAMPEAHGDKDLDDFIFSLIRNPEFPEKVNDIVVECGNSLYQSILDSY